MAQDPKPDGFDDGLTQYFELSARRAVDDSMSTWIEVRPDLVDARGHVLAGVVAYAVDSAVGMAAGFAALPNWIVTADMDLHFAGAATAGPVRADSRVVRAGSRQILVECTVTDEGTDVVVAAATVNHTVLPPDRGLPMAPPPIGEIISMRGRGAAGASPAHLLAHYGVETPAGEPGVAVLSITGPARNPWGIMHGFLFATLAEQALLSAVPDSHSASIRDLMLRFVAPARAATARAEATHIVGDLWRVVIRDGGGDNRVCSTVLARMH